MRFTNGFDPAFVDRVFFRARLWRLEKSPPRPRQSERNQWKGERHTDENDDKQIGIGRHARQLKGLKKLHRYNEEIRSERGAAKSIFLSCKRARKNLAASLKLNKPIATSTKSSPATSGCGFWWSSLTMGLSKDWREFLELLNSRGVDYVIVGAHCVALHGRPRYTGDLDILVRSTPENARLLVDILNEFGFAKSGFKE